MTIFDRLNQLPPSLCRLVAHNRKRPLSHQDIANASGLAKSTVVKISQMDRWDSLPLCTIEAFSKACGVNFMSPKRSLLIIRRSGMAYIENSHPAQRRMFLRMLSDLNKKPRPLT